MKKILAVAVAFVAMSFFASAQVLESSGMKNTLWTGFGSPSEGDLNFYGITDVVQGRYDYGKFTMEGMLNWGFVPNYKSDGNVVSPFGDVGKIDNFVLGIIDRSPLHFHYGPCSNTCDTAGLNNYINKNNVKVDPFYVNFFWNADPNLSVGFGTKLNWSVGVAPGYGDYVWSANAHVRQGGFSTAYDDRSGSFMGTTDILKGQYQFNVDKPGTADVVGFVHYANHYAKSGVGVRYMSDASDNFGLQVGLVMPNGFNTDDPAVNFGIEVDPVNWLRFAFAVEGLLDDAENIFTSASFGFDMFTLDAYIAWDRLFTDADDDEAYGTGAAITFGIPRTKITLRPEIGINFFEERDYTTAWFTGCSLNIPFTKAIAFLAYGSFAQGSRDKNWDDYSATEDYNGGYIATVRPQFKFILNANTVFDVYLNYEHRAAFDGEVRNCWSSGLYFAKRF